jgi:hypothetical protein
LNDGNNFSPVVSGNSFRIEPGTYLLAVKGKNSSANNIGVIGMNEFGGTKSFASDMFLRHEPFAEVSQGRSFKISAQIVGLDTGKAHLQVSRFGNEGRGGGFRIIPMVKRASEYVAEIPADMVTPGVLNYRIVLQKGNEFAVFPGNRKENPFAWDSYNNEVYKTFVAAPNGRLTIFDPTVDRTARVYANFRGGFLTNYTAGERSGQLILRLSATLLSGDCSFGFVHYFGDKLLGRRSELDSLNRLFIRARTAGAEPVKAKVTLTDKDAFSFSTLITLPSTFRDVEVPLTNLVQDSMLLLPRPYPGFLPLRFKGSGNSVFNFSAIEKIQITIGGELPELKKPYSLDVETIWIEKRR